MKKRTIALVLPILLLSGCAAVQDGVNWLFFPNETAVRKEWEEQQAQIDADMKALQVTAAAIEEDRRAKIEALAETRVEIDRAFEKAKIDYSADVALLNVQEAAIIMLATNSLAAVQSDVASLQDRYAGMEIAFEAKLAKATTADNVLAASVFGLLGLAGGGGLVAARVGPVIRERVAQARDEQGNISREEGFKVVWDSIEAAKEASPEFREIWERDQRVGEVASMVLKAAGSQYVFMADQKKQERKGSA